MLNVSQLDIHFISCWDAQFKVTVLATYKSKDKKP